MKRQNKNFTIFCNQIDKKYLILVIPKNTINLIWRKKHKTVKTTKITDQQLRGLENLNIAYIKLAFKEHPKIPLKLSDWKGFPSKWS